MTAKVLKFIENDPYLSKLYFNFGTPDNFDREPCFESLVKIILEQLVSLKSAEITFERLKLKLNQITPHIVLQIPVGELRDCGITRQKTKTIISAAEAIINNTLDLLLLNELNDKDAIDHLKQIHGIGDWTANIYLMMAMKRENIWPVGDRALVVAVKEIFNLSDFPNQLEMEDIGDQWQPFRSIAAQLCWSYYLNTPRQK